VSGGNTTSVSHGARARPRVAVGREQGCVDPASGAMKSGSRKAAMSSVSTVPAIVEEDVTARLGELAPVVKVKLAFFDSQMTQTVNAY